MKREIVTPFHFRMSSIEIEERQAAEVEFVAAAYSPEEAWVRTIASSNNREVCRRLELTPYNDSSEAFTNSTGTTIIEMRLLMPDTYPVNELSPLIIDALISSSESSSSSSRKIAMDAIPALLKACRSVAKECVGQEALFAVLSRADEWIVGGEWHDFCKNYNLGNFNSRSCQNPASVRVVQQVLGADTDIDTDIDTDTCEQKMVVLARKLIYSHHIIAKSKRKAIADLSRDYQLGGMAKIGWPGIIIIEGEENNCDRFIDDIRSMRWQHLVVRGEELEHVPVPVTATIKNDHDKDRYRDLDDLRRFPLIMEELGEDQMSELAARCRDAGLEDLFKTSMKMYKKDPEDGVSSSSSGKSGAADGMLYAMLLHVDHMNDKKAYEKWIQKACKAAGCSFDLKRCYKNDNPLLRPIIFVCILGDEDNVKQLMKRWRTSRVDVDSKGQPCLERMMSVLVEGEIIKDATIEHIMKSCDDYSKSRSRHSDGDSDKQKYTSIKDMKEYSCAIGGEVWEHAVLRPLNT